MMKKSIKKYSFIISEILILFISIILISLNKTFVMKESYYIIFFLGVITTIVFEIIINYQIISLSNIFDYTRFILRSGVIIFFILLFVITIRIVDGTSMNDTLKHKQNIYVFHLYKNINKGDIIVFKVNKDEDYVKRVVGVEGDVISVKKYLNSTYLFINDEVVTSYSSGKYYIMDLESSMQNILIPKNMYFVVGDNALNSKDSRSSDIGLINISQIIGKKI